MFTQRISMDCTKEQYEKYLKDELLKMGYKEENTSLWDVEKNCFISNNYDLRLGYVGNITKSLSQINDRTYLGSFNPELFLALAAMTDNPMGNYGEYVVGKLSGGFYRMIDKDCLHPTYNTIRKATKEEIMAKFDEKIEYPSDFTYITEAEMISLLKSKGYKILRKIETWKEV